MNRLGGWWRLWVACSALWMVVVLFLAIQGWPNKLPVLAPDDWVRLSPESRKLLSYFPIDDRPKPELDPQNPFADIVASVVPVIFLASDGFEKKLSPDTTKAQLNELSADYSRVQKSVLKRNRIAHFNGFLALWIIPCVIAALIGLATRWVIRGFKQASTGEA